MTQFEVTTSAATVDDAESAGADFFGTATAADVAALLDPTAAGKALVEDEPEDWCAFGEA